MVFFQWLCMLISVSFWVDFDSAQLVHATELWHVLLSRVHYYCRESHPGEFQEGSSPHLRCAKNSNHASMQLLLECQDVAKQWIEYKLPVCNGELFEFMHL